MTEQTKAQQLAERLDACGPVDFDGDFKDAATELRRLDENEAALLEALRKIAAYRPLTFAECSDAEAIMGIAESAIAKATGAQHETPPNPCSHRSRKEREMTNHITLPCSNVEAAYTLHGYAQGTREAVAFNQGARWSAALAAQQAEPLTDSYVQVVPDKCDRIVWRNRYYHLPITAPQPAQPVAVPVICGVTRVDRDFYFQADAQQHIPTLLLSFTPVPVNSACDAKGWKDRDALADWLSGPTPPADTVPVLEPLTDEEIEKLNWSYPQPGETGTNLAQVRNVRAVEAAHRAKLAKRGGV